MLLPGSKPAEVAGVEKIQTSSPRLEGLRDLNDRRGFSRKKAKKWRKKCPLGSNTSSSPIKEPDDLCFRALLALLCGRFLKRKIADGEPREIPRKCASPSTLRRFILPS
jgi:hypothetical protein